MLGSIWQGLTGNRAITPRRIWANNGMGENIQNRSENTSYYPYKENSKKLYQYFASDKKSQMTNAAMTRSIMYWSSVSKRR